MKKLFLLFAVFATALSFAGNPIAVKSLGIDSASGLPRELRVYEIDQNSTEEWVVVRFQIVIISPNGKVFVEKTDSYSRINIPADTTKNRAADLRFDALRNSAIGQGETQMIVQTLSVLNTIADLPKLQQ